LTIGQSTTIIAIEMRERSLFFLLKKEASPAPHIFRLSGKQYK